MSRDGEALLSVRDLHVWFGGLRAVHGVELTLRGGELIGVIGPNGAGKTTLFNAVTGAVTPRSGSVVFQGEEMVGRRPHEIVARGLARTFQTTQLFGQATVRQHMGVARHLHDNRSMLAAVVRPPRYRRQQRAQQAAIAEILAWAGIEETVDERVGALTTSQRQRLAICMALATEPQAILLDEPMAGLGAEAVSELVGLLSALRDRGLGVVLIEHHVKVVLSVSERVYVLDKGEVIASGGPQDVSVDPRVVDAYLGASHAADS